MNLARRIVDAIADRQGEDVLLLNIRELTILADYFVIASTFSRRQTKAIVNGVVEETKRDFDTKPLRVEGDPESGWVLMDYGGVVVHLFAPEARAYYDLEDLWKDAQVVVRMF